MRSVAPPTSWLGLALVLGVPIRGAAEPAARCDAAATVEGDLASAASAGLAARGIDVTPRAGCPSVHARVVTADGYIAVDVVDPAGRASTRRVGRVGEAVSLIESWARAGSSSELMPDLAVEPPASAAPVNRSRATTSAPPISAPAAIVEPSVTTAAPPPVRLAAAATIHTAAEPREREARRGPVSLAITGDVALDRAAERWFGTSLGVCTPVLRVCAGGAGHLRRSGSGGTEIALLGAIDLPIVAGRVTIIPGLGVGAGVVSVQMSSDGQNQQQDRQWNLRAEAHVHLTYPISHLVLVDLSLAGVTAPGSTDSQSQNGSGSDSGPDVMVQLGAGLRFGVP